VPVISDAAPHIYPLSYFRENAQAAESILLSGSANCPCCAGAA